MLIPKLAVVHLHQQVRGVLSHSTGPWPVRLQVTLVPKRQMLAHVVHLVALLRCMA